MLEANVLKSACRALGTIVLLDRITPLTFAHLLEVFLLRFEIKRCRSSEWQEICSMILVLLEAFSRHGLALVHAIAVHSLACLRHITELRRCAQFDSTVKFC